MTSPEQIKLLWWRIRCTFHAIRLMRCSLGFAWGMATADDDSFLEGEPPLDALKETFEYDIL